MGVPCARWARPRPASLLRADTGQSEGCGPPRAPIGQKPSIAAGGGGGWGPGSIPHSVISCGGSWGHIRRQIKWEGTECPS